MKNNPKNPGFLLEVSGFLLEVAGAKATDEDLWTFTATDDLARVTKK